MPNDITLGATTFSNIVIRDNWLNNNGISNTNSYPTSIGRNFGLTTTTRYANSGTVSVNATSVAVTHGLSYTPTIENIFVTPTTAWGSMAEFYVSNPTSTQFTINLNPTPGQSVTFAWQVARRY